MLFDFLEEKEALPEKSCFDILWSTKKLSTFTVEEKRVQSNCVRKTVEEHFEAVRDMFNPSSIQKYDGPTDRFGLYQYFLLLCIGDFNYAEFKKCFLKEKARLLLED